MQHPAITTGSKYTDLKYLIPTDDGIIMSDTYIDVKNPELRDRL